MRYKTFDSTGIAPNGKLFAGDLNAIQDMKADASDFTQTIDLSTLRIGDAAISLSKFGAGEAQVAADFRVTKILRGLEGIIPGAFTTTQRDALAVGRAPYGLAILNTVKNKWEWNTGTDAARNWQPFGIDSTIGVYGSRPAASAVVPGSRYWATDKAVEYISDGSSWFRMSIPAGTTVAWFNAVVPTGWVKYDSTNLPSSTGIYDELATHLGGVATPDTRGRAIYGLGTHADVNAILDADVVTVSSRRPIHNHTKTAGANALYGGGAFGSGSSGWTVADFNIGPQTGAEPTDGPPWITGLYIAKL